jgi:hypothetical protein
MNAALEDIQKGIEAMFRPGYTVELRIPRHLCLRMLAWRRMRTFRCPKGWMARNLGESRVMKLYKTPVVVWTQDYLSDVELGQLAQEAERS